MATDQIEIRLFAREDFEAYRKWYVDPDLNHWLGPMDEEWLDHILSDKTGRQYAFDLKGELVGVLGIELPTPLSPSVAITDISVRPDLKRNRFASRLLRQFIVEKRSPLWKSWIAFVDQSNTIAQAFFRANNWQTNGDIDASGMICFTLQAV